MGDQEKPPLLTPERVEQAAELSERGLQFLLELLMELPGRERSELAALSREELWGVAIAFNFLAGRLEAVRQALRAVAEAAESDGETEDCDHR